MGEKSRFFMETRYNYVSLGNLGVSGTAYTYDVNLQYLPLTFGFRF